MAWAIAVALYCLFEMTYGLGGADYINDGFLRFPTNVPVCTMAGGTVCAKTALCVTTTSSNTCSAGTVSIEDAFALARMIRRVKLLL
jgi:hypothetical protein